MKIKNILIALLVITLGCKDEFLLDSVSYDPIMVVDGLISNEPGPYTVKLSQSSPVNSLKKFPYEDCIVTIIENSDKSEILTEIEPGIYATSEGGIQGVIGNKYSILIITPEGKEYKTESQEMKESLEIEALYEELIYKDEEDNIYGLPGYQFYTDSKTADHEENYFLWNMIETYEYTANHIIYDIIDVYGILGTLEEYKNLYRCWKTQDVKYLFTGKTSNLTIPKIRRQPLHFVGTDTKKLQERYSLLLKQYSIGEESYYFWKNVEGQISEENFLIANQPYNIIGNIIDSENPNEIVFGNFTVASVTEKRIFVDRPYADFYYQDDCSIAFEYSKFTEVFLIDLPDYGKVKVSEWCINCTLDGGEAFKPDFWINK